VESHSRDESGEDDNDSDTDGGLQVHIPRHRRLPLRSLAPEYCVNFLSPALLDLLSDILGTYRSMVMYLIQTQKSLQ
jgi:hypothetical protein